MKLVQKENYKLWDFSDHRIQSLVFKVTEQCNLACKYCYRQGMIRAPKRIDLKTVENSIAGFAKWIDRHSNKRKPIYLIWHGGEPLIGGVEHFREIFGIASKYKEKGYTIHHAFQTNGTLINQKWLDLFQKHGVLVGISLDGPKHVHDIHRVRWNNKSSFEKTMEGVRLLISNGYLCSVISVISNETVEFVVESLDFFVQEGFESVDFIPSFLHNDPSTLHADSYAEAMIRLYDHWKKHYYNKIAIRFLRDIENIILNNHGSVECELGGCCGEIFSINAYGDVFPCETVSTFREFCIGNINHQDFDSMITQATFNRWKVSVNKIDDYCLDTCGHFDVCKGGCFNRRYKGKGEINLRDPFCSPRHKIIEHIKESLRQTAT